MIFKIIALYMVLKICFPDSSIFGCAIRIVCWILRLCVGLFLLCLFLYMAH